MVLAYMDNRAVQERFDEVFGIAGWKNEFKTAPDGGTLLVYPLSLETNGSPNGMAQKILRFEAVKGGLSGSMKRAAVQWGVGRYLYDLPTSFAQTSLEKTDG
ncbi:Single-stranded DNA-binding protein DdrA [Lactococcus lactis]|nr:Single-stranded DNA-binding protein DdrA [Lactococcus lactis]